MCADNIDLSVENSILKNKIDALEELLKEYEQTVINQSITLNVQNEQLTRINNSLVITMQELNRSNQDLEQFAYIASHDLQEPIRMVISYLQLIERHYKGKLDTDADTFINYAVDGGKRMQQLISDLLLYSRVGRQLKPFKTVDAQVIVSRALVNLEQAIKDRGAVISYDNLPKIDGDEVMLAQLFQNLISNAIKFCKKEKPEVIVSAEKKENNWVFAVKDNGIGIQAEYSEKVYQIFQRLHRRDEYPGTGIGLAVCKKVVELHYGKIWFESEIDKGTTFYFSLPVKQ